MSSAKINFVGLWQRFGEVKSDGAVWLAGRCFVFFMEGVWAFWSLRPFARTPAVCEKGCESPLANRCARLESYNGEGGPGGLQEDHTIRAHYYTLL
jgi:hypothetical protein